MSRPTIICLTPVKNEAWILDLFLKCASLWADHIIIADQMSDDGSRDIVRNYPKVTLVDNPSPTFNEPERQKILLEAARRIPGPRLLIALDADEMLTANFLDGPEWQTLLQAEPGTVIYFDWAILRPDLSTYWLAPAAQPFGFMDDESEHVGRAIHSPRIPMPADAPKINLHDIKAMHYVGVDSARWASKHRWYQCWEQINQPQRRAISIYRQYHRKDVIPAHKVKPVPKEWLLGYEQQGIDIAGIRRDEFFQTDEQMLELFMEYGPERFKRQAIWDVNWSELYRKIHGQAPPRSFQDPRSGFDKLVHRWLEKTQPHFSYFDQEQTGFSRFAVHMTEKMLGRLFGW